MPQKTRRGFSYVPQFVFGVASNKVTVYSRNHRVIGYLQACDVASFEAGNNKVFTPVTGWRTTFSPALAVDLGLQLSRSAIPAAVAA